ncbi:MAG: ABC transporter substrate-binding protein [Anaerolineae bacterium]|nr:ABC transporter substrate-binding protein [Anaerolineae bacterium]
MTIKYKTHYIKLILILPFVLTLLFLSACDGSNGQNGQANKENPTVGIVNLTSALDPVIEGFKAGMEDLGYTEGENITYVYDGPVASIGELDAAAQKLVDANVDLILSLSTPATLAAKRATEDNGIPIIFGTVTDPIATGVVEDLTQLEGNVTGIKTGGSEPKELEWLKNAVPELQRVLILHNPNDASSVGALNDVRATAESLGVEIVAVETPDNDAVLAALQDIPDDVNGILLLPDSIVNRNVGEISAAAIEREIAVVGINSPHVEAGALLAFGSEHYPAGQQAAHLAQQILTGTPPSELPIETADFYLSVNLQTASAIGITIDDTVLKSAETIVR